MWKGQPQTNPSFTWYLTLHVPETEGLGKWQMSSIRRGPQNNMGPFTATQDCKCSRLLSLKQAMPFYSGGLLKPQAQSAKRLQCHQKQPLQFLSPALGPETEMVALLNFRFPTGGSTGNGIDGAISYPTWLGSPQLILPAAWPETEMVALSWQLSRKRKLLHLPGLASHSWSFRPGRKRKWWRCYASLAGNGKMALHQHGFPAHSCSFPAWPETEMVALTLIHVVQYTKAVPSGNGNDGAVADPRVLSQRAF